ncbi:PLP-dependent aminotransferase family protein [Comamonas sp. GB3 AK4-5]|uniref:aminotransferase-like domain-containing protein n=1 Tax=Comamonas sp. GB3 AK4-5 TaxID=3231487 RepID=UPI00351E34CB
MTLSSLPESEPKVGAEAKPAPRASRSAPWHWQPLRGSGVPLVEQLALHVEGLVRSHGLRAGMRLPSVRQLAEDSGVSRDTVVQAYDRLAAQSLIHSRRGAGFFVSALRKVDALETPFPAQTSAAVDRPTDRAIDTPYLLRTMFQQGAAPESSGSAGLLPPQWLEPEMLTGAIRSVGRSAGLSLSGYGLPQGYAPLRQQIAAHLQAQDVPVHPERNLLTVAGVTHGLDLITRLLVRPGDVVLVEDPAWFLIFGHLQALGAQLVGVPRGPDGPDIAALAALAAQHRPRLFIVNTAVHNPTGQTLSAGVAHAMLKVAEQYDFLLVEDDTYADFHPGQPTRLAALDRLQRVLLVGGYSKTLAGGLRVGYIAAQAERIEQLLDLKLLAGLTSAQLGEMVVHRILSEGQYRRHVERLRERVDKARAQCLRRVEALGWQVPQEPLAGMFVWADCGMDSELLARRAAEQGLLLAPGVLFSPRQVPGSMLRLPVPLAQHAAPWELMARLQKQLR